MAGDDWLIVEASLGGSGFTQSDRFTELQNAQLERLFWEQDAMRGFLAIRGAKHGDLLVREVAAGTLKLLDMLAAASPYDTGTLQYAHRGGTTLDGEWVIGALDIDPYVENPVNPGRPVSYGERLVNDGKYANWFDAIAEYYGDSILEDIMNKWLAAYEALWSV